MPVNDHGQPVGDPLPGWIRRPLPSPVRLQGRHVHLEPLGPEHVPPLLRHLCAPDDDALWTYRTTERPRSRAELETLVAADREDRSSLTYAVVPLVSGQAQGLTTLMRIDPSSGVLEIGGVVYARTLQRTAATTETTHLLLRHAFDDLGYRRVEWKCDSLNEPSRRAARRLGFTYEGRFRRHVVVKGRNRDTDWFAIVDDDWPAIRAAHVTWLDRVARDDHVPLGTLTAPLLP